MKMIANRQMNHGLALTAAALLLLTGCKTVVRENIISSVNTGIGISLAENPKTSMYEAKIGFIRSQFYSVPTGKMVECPDGNSNCSSTAADKTPNVVSGIRVDSDFRHLFLGAKIAENFAVGDKAVMSPAAVAMYLTHSPDKPSEETVKAAASGAKALSKISSLPNLDREQIDLLQALENVATVLPSGTPGRAKALSEYEKINEVIAGLNFTDYTARPAVGFTMPAGLSGPDQVYRFRQKLRDSLNDPTAPPAEKTKLEALLKRVDSDLAKHPGTIGLYNFTVNTLNPNE
jgi:hypothetical protein